MQAFFSPVGTGISIPWGRSDAPLSNANGVRLRLHRTPGRLQLLDRPERNERLAGLIGSSRVEDGVTPARIRRADPQRGGHAKPRRAANAESDPLPSWNAGPAKDAIVKFIHATTDAASPNFVPLADRIATFDQDGTLWVEHPIYTQLVFAFDRVPQVVKERPELADEPAFKAVLSGDREVIASLRWRRFFPLSARP